MGTRDYDKMEVAEELEEEGMEIAALAQTKENASDKTEELKKKLAFYSMFGLPLLSRDLRMFWEIREGNETSIRLESSWRDIVKGHESISRKNSHQQEAIWELLCTELSYMKKLRIITDLFICGLLNLHSSGFLNEVCVSSSTAKVG
ncbi:pleckstrin homology domain-containing family G member 5-like [Microcaecilia unicolor]|uniref:Pleckstrin homology domain-containing family G member 5-like n=1 Tax=Microcaecilia unicolor TaxID=1415580 RepID=A0A6P7X306_9AMPH|nr:pleckstrin homology domain-containing family G member 5-like [Microcaecilia unicolor]